MEWLHKYEKFNQTEKQLFKRLVNQLMAKTFIIRDEYDVKEGRIKIHSDYRFVERAYEVFSGYLELGGWTIHRDSDYGVIYISSMHDYNKFKMNKFTTLMMLSLRLLFEERREEVSLRNEVLFESYELISKMQVLGIIDKKPAMKDIADGYKLLSSFNILEKLSGKWDGHDAKFVILPSILFIIPNDKISLVSEMVKSKEDEIDDESSEFDDETELMEDLL